MSGDWSKGRAGSSNMTRRQLLQRFGMIGGSSLVMGAMGALDLMAAPAGPRPVLQRGRADARVIILGAGMSGLVTGLELAKLGYDYQILEARQRVGGLNWSVKRGHEHTELGPSGERQVCQFDEGQYFNAGPWRIPHTHHGLLGYARELGVRMEQFNDANEVLFTNDAQYGVLANRKVRLRELESDLRGNVGELLAKAVNQGALDQQISTEDKQRLIQFLVGAGYLSSPDELYALNPDARGSADKYDLTTLLRSPLASQVRSLIAGTGGTDPVFQPTGGMMELPEAMARAQSDKIRFGSEVQSVTQNDTGIAVRYRDAQTGAVTEVTGDYCVSCLPMSILKKLQVNLSPAMQAAVNDTDHAVQAKIGLQMRRRFWEEDDNIYGGHLVYVGAETGAAPAGGGGNPIPQFSYPSNDYGSKKGVLLGFYGSARLPGLDGRPLAGAPVAARIEHVLHHASPVHPQIRAEYENAYAVWWERVQYSEGAWASNPGDRLAQLSKADGRIYIGSGAASPDPAWMEGAVESAWRTVEAIHKRAQVV